MNAATRPRPAPAAAGRVPMRAIVQRRYGTVPEEVLRLEETARPVAGRSEVLVRVRAAGLDRGTWHLMAGLPYLARFIGFGLRGPKIPVPGWAVAGTVEAIGGDVTGIKPGDEVFGTCRGSFAEYAVTLPGRLVPKPGRLTFEQAAALPISATTALHAVRDNAKVRPGQHVLVIGAGGGVGTFAVQFAKALGAQVTAACGPAKTDVVRAAGADHVLDYTREDPASGQRRYDAIIDIGGGRPVAHLRGALTSRGALVLTGNEDGGRLLGGMGRNAGAQLLSPFVSQRLTAPIVRESHADLVTLAEMASAGTVTPAIDRVYPLGEAAAALRYLAEGRARGKIVISVSAG
jgi:NADPH:quinone reductase-like Zn-dependent oxidoreductase